MSASAHLRSSSIFSNSDFANADGYSTNVFEGKAAQMAEVAGIIAQQGFLPAELIQNEVAWFYNNLGIDDMYFQMEGDQAIAGHIMGLYSAKVASFVKGEHSFSVNLEQEAEEEAVYIHNSCPGITDTTGPNYEKRIEAKYLDPSAQHLSYRLESYRSQGTVSSSLKTQLRCYFVKKCQFVNPSPSESELCDIRQVSDKTFLAKATDNTLEIYQRVIEAVLQRTGPVIEMYEVENSRQKRVIIGFRQKSTQAFFSALSDLYHYYRLFSTRKYVENFSNGVTITSLYLSPVLNTDAPPIEHSILQVMKEASLLYCLPNTPLQEYFQTGRLSVQETVYGYCGLVFAQHFLNRLGSEYSTLSSLLDPNNPLHIEVLTKLKKRLRQETFTREYVLDIVKSYPELLRILYVNFAMTHYVMIERESALKPSLSFQRLQRDRVLSEAEIHEKIRQTVSNQHEIMVMESFLDFNRHVLKTNFYQPTKVALSFRLDPSFLPKFEYSQSLFGMFLVIGGEFRGFHLRFRDVARGGIRIIRSRNREAYSINLRSLFDENYALAATQQRKNKVRAAFKTQDIPEGGSKGTVLLDVNQQDKAKVSFEKYVDAILDLLITGHTPGIKEKIVDKYGRSEILFFGPDEGTAEYMDWASQHAKLRGAHFWKAFTTGKSQRMGGIPHDLFGMTTHSIHQYVTGIYRKLGLNEEECRKLQTGGPDGDLGSNEIKLSKDKTIGIVDGSGVLFDPDGISRTELMRLAQKRQMICNFDASQLGPKGFMVLVDERNVSLPDGSLVEDGLVFRNEFHLLPTSTADVFVPCGGRPEAVDINNVGRLLTDEGLSRFKYVVEGANLFFTQAGAIIFKDASANKGGVISSSLEVLAALALNDDEFSRLMQVQDGVVPQFYTDYVEAVHKVIENNARLEFECIWKESAEQPTKTKSLISDELSVAISKLDDELQCSGTLWSNELLRRVILEEALPNMLIKQVGVDALLQRIPEAYLRALFASYIASRFIYKCGVQPSQFAFFEFMTQYFERVSRIQCDIRVSGLQL